MSEPKEPNIVDHWLETEAATAPHCPVVAGLKVSTKSTKLDEDAALAKLRELYEETRQSPEDVTNKAD